MREIDVAAERERPAIEALKECHGDGCSHSITHAIMDRPWAFALSNNGLGLGISAWVQSGSF